MQKMGGGGKIKKKVKKGRQQMLAASLYCRKSHYLGISHNFQPSR